MASRKQPRGERAEQTPAATGAVQLIWARKEPTLAGVDSIVGVFARRCHAGKVKGQTHNSWLMVESEALLGQNYRL